MLKVKLLLIDFTCFCWRPEAVLLSIISWFFTLGQTEPPRGQFRNLPRRQRPLQLLHDQRNASASPWASFGEKIGQKFRTTRKSTIDLFSGWHEHAWSEIRFNNLLLYFVTEQLVQFCRKMMLMFSFHLFCKHIIYDPELVRDSLELTNLSCKHLLFVYVTPVHVFNARHESSFTSCLIKAWDQRSWTPVCQDFLLFFRLTSTLQCSPTH